MKISAASLLLYCVVLPLASANPMATDTVIYDDDDIADSDRYIQVAKLAVANVDRDLTVPEQYFLQGCLRKALETTDQQNNLVTLEVMESSSLSSFDEQDEAGHGRSLTDWSWLYSYSIFFEYGRDCYYDDYICSGGRRRRLGSHRNKQKQYHHFNHRIERYMCQHLRRGPYPVFHDADACHVEFEPVESE